MAGNLGDSRISSLSEFFESYWHCPWAGAANTIIFLAVRPRTAVLRFQPKSGEVTNVREIRLGDRSHRPDGRDGLGVPRPASDERRRRRGSDGARRTDSDETPTAAAGADAARAAVTRGDAE